MRRRSLPAILLLATTAVGAARQPAPPADRSYAVGFTIGDRTRIGLERDGVGVDHDLLVNGFRDGLAGDEPLFKDDDMEALLEAVHREMQRRMVQRLLDESPEFRELHDRNLRLSRGFAEEFGGESGVVTTPEGLQYLVLRHGPESGHSPRPGDTVVLDLEVKLLDGTVLVKDEHVEAALEDLVPGGQELLQRMKIGDRWQFAIPPELACGAAGRYPDIGPNQTMVGLVELLEVRP